MAFDIDFGNDEEPDVSQENLGQIDPDKFLAKNAFRVFYQSNNFFLPQIKKMIELKEAINLRPEYQRRLRWTNRQKSNLIESFLLNIPIPPVFFYENDAARYEVMDGQQRMNTISEFFADKFRLIGLKILTPLNGLKYSTCPPRVTRTLSRASISVIVLLMESETKKPSQNTLSSTDIRRFVFDRLNTGGTKLNPQEIRNALNPGPFNDAIIRLSRTKVFTDVFGIPAYSTGDTQVDYEDHERKKNPLYSSMRDCELILRYFALKDDNNIRGSMKGMLDRAMEEKLTKCEANQIEKEYIRFLEFLFELFDGKPFKISPPEEKRPFISASLYDASMVATKRLSDSLDDILKDKRNVQMRLKSAIQDSRKYEVIVGRKNTAEAVRTRIDLLQSILKPS